MSDFGEEEDYVSVECAKCSQTIAYSDKDNSLMTTYLCVSCMDEEFPEDD